MQTKQWQYGMNIVFGLLLFALPWLFGFEATIPVRSWDFFIVGLVTVASAALALHKASRAGEWATLALGAWMFVSPWILGFSGNEAARNGALLLGFLIVAMSLGARVERFLSQRPGNIASAG